MNERIKELMEQAKRPLGELHPKMANTGAKWDMVLDPEKFAELIVRECAEIARTADLEDVDGGDSAVLRAAGDQIKKTFWTIIWNSGRRI